MKPTAYGPEHSESVSLNTSTSKQQSRNENSRVYPPPIRSYVAPKLLFFQYYLI